MRRCILEILQEYGIKGLTLIYEIAPSSLKSMITEELISMLLEGKKKQMNVTEDTELFEKGALGKTPSKHYLSTYKEICSLATEMNQPEIVQKFMQLASHSTLWASKEGAAHSLSRISMMAANELCDRIQPILPKLYRNRFDPISSIAMSFKKIWDLLVQDPKELIDKRFDDIIQELISNQADQQWRIREAS
jgi:proteasome component ECM29